MSGLILPPGWEEKNRPQPQGLIGGFGGSGYDGMNHSTRRGYVYFPTLNTVREVTPHTRLEGCRRARYLTRNTGYAKRCTYGLAGMVGYLSPRPFTTSSDWNDKSETAFERRFGFGQGIAFDRSGRFNVYSAQPKMTAARMIDGDIGVALTESQSGGAMVAFYEGHQIGNGMEVATGLIDGCRVQNDRTVGYRLLDPENYENTVEVPASNFILHGDTLSFGQRRGVSSLHHAITNLLDITEIRSDVKLGIKLGNQIGYYIAREALTRPTTSGPRGMGGEQKVEYADNGEPILVEKVTRGGKLLTLQPGEEIKQLLDQRPHPNSREFLEDLNRDISWGVGVSPDVLWNIAKLGGASVRYVLADCQQWIEAQQQLLIDQFLHRLWVYFISKEIKAGRLEPCPDPDWYFKVGWQPQAKMTVDIGRDGKLSIDLHRAGMLTLKRWYGQQGFDAEPEIRQYVREYAMKLKICDEVGKEYGITLDPDKVFPLLPGQGNNSQPDNVIQGTFGTEDVQQMLVEIRDGMTTLRNAA